MREFDAARHQFFVKHLLRRARHGGDIAWRGQIRLHTDIADAIFQRKAMIALLDVSLSRMHSNPPGAGRVRRIFYCNVFIFFASGTMNATSILASARPHAVVSWLRGPNSRAAGLLRIWPGASDAQPPVPRRRLRLPGAIGREEQQHPRPPCAASPSESAGTAQLPP